MPRSGGGGSHRGGSHSSSHSGSSHRSGSSYRSGSSDRSGSSYRSGSGYSSPVPTYSRSYFAGAQRYVYYDRQNRIQSYFALNPVHAPSRVLHVLTWILCGFFILIGAAASLSMIFRSPAPVRGDPAPAAVLDEYGMFPNGEAARQQLQTFTEETGITTCIVGIRNDDWQGYFDDLEVCAYEYYINLFDNEDSLLILYSQPELPDAGFNDWYFEIIYGDNTVKLLTDRKMDAFREDIQQGLLHWGAEPETAIAQAVADLGEGMMEAEGLTWVAVECFLLLSVVPGVILFFKTRKYRTASMEAKAVRVDNFTREETCEYCGTRYIPGIASNCRNCNAPLKVQAR